MTSGGLNLKEPDRLAYHTVGRGQAENATFRLWIPRVFWYIGTEIATDTRATEEPP